ncbi:MAG: hypothetical protein FWC50_15440 [Planctomycetaceae bacterium]|nr:hypothetical protein [Planctomycetaceae bacterium]
MTRIYFDNCCYNRPFDDQSNILIRLEVDAKLHIQEMVKDQKLELVWSFVLDYENSVNPFADKRERESRRGGVWPFIFAVSQLKSQKRHNR